MKLTTELEFTNKVKPIELPDRSWENYIGEKAMVVGFGKTDVGLKYCLTVFPAMFSNKFYIFLGNNQYVDVWECVWCSVKCRFANYFIE